jgi:hypothetical protein
LSALALVVLLFTGVSCSPTATGPTEAPAAAGQQPDASLGIIGDLTNSVVGTLGSVTDVLLCSPQPYASTTKTIGPDGGLITVGTHSLFIPPRALKTDVTITAEQVRGSTNSIRFSPEGLEFQYPAALTMRYDNCALVLLQKKIVYTDEKLKVLEVLRSLDLFRSKSVSAPIHHFSRYAVAY